MTVINVSDITTKEIDGTGVFDQLMVSVNTQLTKEFKAKRIAASDYSKVYLSALDTTMQQSIAFLLGKQTADAQAELLKAQKAIADQELINLTKQGLILDEQYNEQVAKVALVIQQKINMESDNLKTIEDTGLVSQNIQNAITGNTTLLKQQDKIDAETGLLGQKKLTEEAQIKDVVSGSTVVGVVGKQKDLYSKQAEGFLRDAEQKGAKIIVDTWNLRQSTDGALADPAGLSDVSVKAVVDKLKAGIGA